MGVLKKLKDLRTSHEPVSPASAAQGRHGRTCTCRPSPPSPAFPVLAAARDRGWDAHAEGKDGGGGAISPRSVGDVRAAGSFSPVPVGACFEIPCLD